MPEIFSQKWQRWFWLHVERTPNSCWLWCGDIAEPGGHGVVIDPRSGDQFGAHKMAWLLVNGPVVPLDGENAPRRIICHKCDLPICVNPAHLYIGTYQTNARDREVRGRHLFYVEELGLRGASGRHKTDWIRECLHDACGICQEDQEKNNSRQEDGDVSDDWE